MGMKKLVPPALCLHVQYAVVDAELPNRAQVRRWVRAALAVMARQQPIPDTELTVRFVGTREGQQLNGQYRGKDYATNVLTFNFHDMTEIKAFHEPVVADLVVCVPVVKREARQQRKTFYAHCAHMVVHGVLHAHGLDHQNDDEAVVMESLEAATLQRFGLSIPPQDFAKK